MASWLSKIFNRGEAESIDWSWPSDVRVDTSASTYHHSSGGARGARTGGQYFNGSKFPFGVTDGSRGLNLDHRAIRQNARVLTHENLAASALVNRHADTVVWTGLKCEPNPVVSLLGIAPEQGRDWSKNTGARFDLYMADKKSSLDETQNIYQMTGMVGRYQMRDNDYFFRLHRKKNLRRQSPLQVQIIDPEQIISDSYTSTWGPTLVDDGIKRDENGKEISYTVRIQKRDGTEKFVEVPAMTSNGKRLMGHGFFAEYAGQGRGYSLLSVIIQELANLTDYTTSEIKRAIAQSQIMGFVLPSKDRAASAPLQSMMQEIATGGVSGAITGLEDLTPAEQSAALGVSPLYEATHSQPGGTFIDVLKGGESIEFPKMTSPSSGFPEFVSEFWTHLGASVGQPQEVMRMKFGSNYSASRAALVMYWQVAEIWRKELESDFLNEIYEAWLDIEIAEGRITAPGWSDPRMRAAWLNSTWYGLPLPHIDPKKEAEATKSWLEMSLTNQEREARAHNGSSAETNVEKNREMFERTPHAPWAPTEAVHGHPEADEDEDEDENEEE